MMSAWSVHAHERPRSRQPAPKARRRQLPYEGGDLAARRPRPGAVEELCRCPARPATGTTLRGERKGAGLSSPHFAGRSTARSVSTTSGQTPIASSRRSLPPLLELSGARCTAGLETSPLSRRPPPRRLQGRGGILPELLREVGPFPLKAQVISPLLLPAPHWLLQRGRPLSCSFPPLAMNPLANSPAARRGRTCGNQLFTSTTPSSISFIVRGTCSVAVDPHDRTRGSDGLDVHGMGPADTPYTRSGRLSQDFIRRSTPSRSRRLDEDVDSLAAVSSDFPYRVLPAGVQDDVRP